ncbi:MipA/OmpV family protein [Gallaecimonas kandeliae]|uniref:MipA/OmpV family protein n=1 Tax=Gallaecimonas kandeliae TaxID=3029055 RepID=UPI0026470B39|nr:MipA/OmpV family protein [Gallaecimonas kandeliae]WKE65850.1 MipA/OmpV family protein [Gallaecimonas kandeliae]
MMRPPLLSLLYCCLLSLVLLWSDLALAAESTEGGADWRLSMAVGVGRYGSVLRDGEDIPLYVLPRWSFYYKRFYVEDLDLGFNLLQSGHWSFDLTTKQSFDALLLRGSSLGNAFFSGLASANIPIGVPFGVDPKKLIHPAKRTMSYLGGATLYWQNQDWQLSSAWHTDISGVHRGSEWENKVRYQQHLGPLDLALTAGARRLSSSYSNYYFGVHKQDNDFHYQYEPGAQWLPSLKMESRFPLGKDKQLVASWKREWLPKAYDKNLFFDQRHQDIWFVGVSWAW